MLLSAATPAEPGSGLSCLPQPRVTAGGGRAPGALARGEGVWEAALLRGSGIAGSEDRSVETRLWWVGLHLRLIYVGRKIERDEQRRYDAVDI